MLRFLAASAALAILFGLCACGGGGGNPPPPPTTINSLTFSLSTNEVDFAAPSLNVPPDTPPNATVKGTVTATGGSVSGILYIVVDVPNPNIATVTGFAISGNSGFATVVPSPPATLGLGSFTETITVRACLNDPTCATGQIQGSPQSVIVNYTVPGIASTASSLMYSIGNSPGSANFNSTFQVSGYPSQSWSAISSVPWLTVAPSGASTAATVSVTAALDQTLVNTFEGGTYTGTVTLTPTTGAPITMPVTLTIQRTQVNYVAPYVAVAGTTGNVILRGVNFSLITPTAVNFGTTAATSFTVVSDTEIHATYPALQAGTYTVHVANSQGVDRTNAQLSVVNPTAFTSALLQYPTTGNPAVTGLVYDAARQALLVNLFYGSQGVGSGAVLRYGYSSGWAAPTSVALTGDSAIAESVDGASLIAAYLDQGSNQFTVAQLDPVTLGAVKTAASPNNAVTGVTIASSNNGHILIGAKDPTSADYWPLYEYSLRTGSLTNLTAGSVGTHVSNVAASLDGSALLIENPASGVVTQQYNSSQDTLVAAAAQVSADSVQLNRDGSRVMFTTAATLSGPEQVNIYDASLNLLGGLPTSTSLSVFSPTSSRVYTYDTNGTVRVFDLSQPTVGGVFPEVLPALTPLQNGYEWAMAITPDEGAVFLAGSGGVAVVPLH